MLMSEEYAGRDPGTALGEQRKGHFQLEEVEEKELEEEGVYVNVVVGRVFWG
jgi:hypothetical protein